MSKGVIPVPGPEGLVIIVEVVRAVVIVSSLEPFPVFETKLILPGHVRTAAAVTAVGTSIEVPLADVRGPLFRTPEDPGYRVARRIKLYIVYVNAVIDRVLTGHQACAIRAADRAPEHGMSQIGALLGQHVEYRRVAACSLANQML